MTKPEEGKHARAKERVKAATLLVPAALTGAAVAFAVGTYQPLVFDPDSIVAASKAEAAELQTAEATSEKTTAEDPVIESNFGLDIGNLSDGVYTGSARGYKSVITVQVTVSGGKITDIQIVSQGDDEPYFTNATAVIQRVLSAQSMNVDTVSGATYSSTGILVAIKNALLQAAGQQPVENAVVAAQQTTSHQPASNTSMPVGTMKDGTYTGSAMGYNDNITVSVTVAGGKIASIAVVSEDDDEPYFTNARAVISRILSSQTTNVDAVTGATYSSKGIMSAVAQALQKAVDAANGGGSSSGSASDGGSGGNSGSGTGGSGSGGDSADPAPTPTPTPDSGSADSDNPDAAVHYADGEYTAYAYCADTARPDRYEPYYVALTVTVKDGAVAGISNVHGSATGAAGDAALSPYNAEDNDEYLGYAANGRTRKGATYIGVVNQLLKGTASASISPVSGATYSSRAIAAAYDAALEQAAAVYKKQQEEVGGSGSGAAAGDASGSGDGSSSGATASFTAGSRGSASTGSAAGLTGSATVAGSTSSTAGGGNA